MIYLWIAALFVFVIIEGLTVSLVSIWFAVGSIAAVIAAAAGAPLWLQIVLFLAVSVIVLSFVRPLAKNYINVLKKPTNADRVIGMVCPVIETIDNTRGTGAVTVDGKIWTARSENGEPIPQGTLVTPVSIQGVKLIVETAKAAEPAMDI